MKQSSLRVFIEFIVQCLRKEEQVRISGCARMCNFGTNLAQSKAEHFQVWVCFADRYPISLDASHCTEDHRCFTHTLETPQISLVRVRRRTHLGTHQENIHSVTFTVHKCINKALFSSPYSGNPFHIFWLHSSLLPLLEAFLSPRSRKLDDRIVASIECSLNLRRNYAWIS